MHWTVAGVVVVGVVAKLVLLRKTCRDWDRASHVIQVSGGGEVDGRRMQRSQAHLFGGVQLSRPI